jgi:hypothetical protein
MRRCAYLPLVSILGLCDVEGAYAQKPKTATERPADKAGDKAEFMASSIPQ